MGLFDDIRCQYALPLPENQGELAGRDWREQIFQTKDFECLMITYVIREDGTLGEQTYDFETNRKGLPRRKPTGWQALSSYTGTVCFYNSIYGNNADYWVEWIAVFVCGKVSELKLHQWEERDNRERLASEAKWNLRTKKHEKFLATWAGRHIYPAYAWGVYGCLEVWLHRFCRWITKLCSRTDLMILRMADRLAPYGDPIRAAQRERVFCALFDDDWDG
jgi:hypothetical protein